jgi:hypothetical protein
MMGRRGQTFPPTAIPGACPTLWRLPLRFSRCPRCGEHLRAERIEAMSTLGDGPVMRWEDLYDELYDSDDRAAIEQLKARAAVGTQSGPALPGSQEPRPDAGVTSQ